MNHDEIINLAIQELKECDKPYMPLKDFCFMEGLKPNDKRFQKIRYILIKSSPFEKHSESAIKLSPEGLKIAYDYKNWYQYKKTLKPKLDYAKWIAIAISVLSFGWNVYQEITNNKLKEENKELLTKVELLKNTDQK